MAHAESLVLLRRTAAALSVLSSLACSVVASAQPACTARSGPVPPQVVELYTSEGCSSCPPADAWLSTLKGRGDVIALGFHVTYWDRLGWPDRFATEDYTRRQHEIASRHGSRSVYTPQVVVDGRDFRGWPRLPPPAPGGSVAPEVVLTREADGRVLARVAPMGSAAPQRLAAYWAVVEDQHTSRVRAGENAGATLRHDHVVRLHRPLPDFAAIAGLSSRLDVPPGAAAHPRRIVFVVTSVPEARPMQAVALDC